MMDFVQAIRRVTDGLDLSREEIAQVFGLIMEGQATPAQIGGLLIGLRMKGETADELAGAASAMRAHAIECPLANPDTAVDTCGTGGDNSGSVNVSTLAAIVACGAGAVVAKHGNRSISSKSGSADVLECLGVCVDTSVELAARCVNEVGIGFLFAPTFHAATRHAAGPRRELGTRTIFNLLGPLTNPAGVRNQLVGVFARQWCAPVAQALGALGSRRAFVVHGEGGLDEIAIRGATFVAEWDHTAGAVRQYEITPQTFGLDDGDPADLSGGDAAYNADVLRSVLDGATTGVRTAAVMAAAVALVASGLAADLPEAAARAASAIDDGRAKQVLARWGQLSRSENA